MSASPAVHPSIVEARLDLLHASPLPHIVNAFNGTVLVGFTWGAVAPAVSLSWLAALYAVTLARFVNRRAFLARPRPLPDPGFWLKAHAAGAIVMGLLWGATGALLLLSPLPEIHMVVGLVAAGMSAGALAASFAAPWSFHGFLAAAMVPTIAAFAIHGGPTYWAMAVLMSVYVAVLLRTARVLVDGVFGSARIEARLRDSVESLYDGFIVYDPTGRVLTWNSRMIEMFPYLGGRLAPGMALAELLELAASWPAHNLAPEQRAGWIAQQLAVIGKADGMVIIELSDGRSYEARERRTGDGGWVSVFRDVTEQRQAEVEMRRARLSAEAASRAKSQFLANMSHEIRTPLSGVIAIIDSLIEDALPAAQRAKAETARRSAEQLMEVIGDVLDMSKLEAGALRLESVPMRPSAVVDDALQSISARAAAKGLAVSKSVAPAAQGWFLGDPTRLRQVLINLLSNAVKFTQRGEINVSVATQAGQRIEFAVRDTGIGIAPDQVARLFEKFTQADQSISRRFGGTGLGLAIAQEFVTMMGGRIVVESAPGQGSIFRFALELAAATAPEPAAAVAAVPADAGAPLHGRRVLLVEDDAVNRHAAYELLRRCGADVDTAEDGEAGVEAGLAARYDLILMDMQMPRLDGLSAARRLRAAPGPNRATPILALTANAFTDDVAQCLAAGMNAHLVKPLRRLSIHTAIVKHLAAPAPADAEPFDAKTMAALESEMSPETVSRVVRAFVSGREAQMRQLWTAWADGDRETTAREAHSLKGVARIFGAQRLQNAAQALELSAAHIAADDGARLIEDMQSAGAALGRALAERYPETAPTVDTAAPVVAVVDPRRRSVG